jgi:hypothetical protein
VLPEGKAFAAGLEVPDGGFYGTFGHSITTYTGECMISAVGAVDSGRPEQRSDVLVNYQPGSVGRLVIVERIFRSCALAVSASAVRVENLDQQNSASGGSAKAGLKRPSQWHFDLDQFEPLYIKSIWCAHCLPCREVERSGGNNAV